MQASQEMDQELMGKQAEGQNTMKYAKSNKPRLLAHDSPLNQYVYSASSELVSGEAFELCPTVRKCGTDVLILSLPFQKVKMQLYY